MIKFLYGRMAELVDAPDSKSSSSNGVWVRFPLRPPSVFFLGITLVVNDINGSSLPEIDSFLIVNFNV